MIVYRIESPAGHGPWTQHKLVLDDVWTFDDTVWCRQSGYKDPAWMPMAYEEKLLAVGFKGPCIEHHKKAPYHRFAYPSMSVLNKWWGQTAHKRVAARVGYTIGVYQLGGAFSVYQNQVVYDSRYADLLNRLPLE